MDSRSVHRWIRFAEALFAGTHMVCVPGALRAQVAGATITGTVLDPSGSVIPSAQISVQNTSTGIVRKVQSNGNGLYTVPNLLPRPSSAANDRAFGAVPGENASSLIVPGLTTFGGGVGGSSQYRFAWTSVQGYDDAFLTKGVHSIRFGAAVESEMTTVPTEVQGKLSVLPSLTSAQPHLGNPYFSNPTLKNFEPRLGFAWDPFHKGRTAIRGGFGVFDVLPLPYQFELLSSLSAPFFELGSINNLSASEFPKGAFSLLAASSTNLRQSYIEQNPNRNYVMQWNLNVQQQLTNGGAPGARISSGGIVTSTALPSREIQFAIKVVW